MNANFGEQKAAKKAPMLLVTAAVLALGAGGVFFLTAQKSVAEEGVAQIAPAAGEEKPAKADKKAAKEDKKAKAGEEKAAAAPAEDAGSIKMGNPVVGNVNGEDIMRSDVFAFIGNLPPQLQQMPVEQLFPMALEQVINNKLVVAKSADAKLDADPEVIKLVDEAKTQVVRNVYIDRAVTAKVNQKMLLKKYEELLDQLGDVPEVKARHILVDSEEKAKEAIKKLGEGADFATLTKEMWPGAEQQNGGELGYFAKGDMVPEFAEAAFALDKGQYTKDPIKTQFGWHVIKVEDKRNRPQPEFETVKPQLEQQVRQDILSGMLEQWQKDAKVKKFDINGDPVKETKSN